MQAVFIIFKAKEAVEVIEASAVMVSCLLRSLRPLGFSELLSLFISKSKWLVLPFFDVLKKKLYRIVEF